MTPRLDLILGYADRHALESDAYAYREDSSPEHAIVICPMTGGTEALYLSAREARVLASYLIRAADEDDLARAKAKGKL